MKPAALPQRRMTHADKTLVVIPASLARSAYAVVAWPIGTAIIAGISPESAVLAGNADLTARFGISHPVLRESVKMLAVKGLLATRTRVGARVCRRNA